MTIRHLRIFVAVYETGSASKAGQKLFIAQPSVSVAISELEEYYGIKLFDRIAKRLYITEAGKLFYQYAHHVVTLFDDMEKGVKNFDSTGVIRIGASITIGNYLLPKYIKEFKNIYPNMRIEAIIENSGYIEKCIINNKIDLALIEGTTHNEYIKSEEFMDDELVLICGANHKLAKKDNVNITELECEEFLLREKGSAGRGICDGIFTSYDIDLKPTWESSSTQAIIRGVMAELGISILPYLLAKEYIDKGEVKVIKINEVSLKRKFNIIYHKNKFLTESAMRFIQLVKTISYC